MEESTLTRDILVASHHESDVGPKSVSAPVGHIR